MNKPGRWDFLNQKRQEVLDYIAPMCAAFGISDYDYIVNTDTGNEQLRIGSTLIGCCANSNTAVRDELIGWLFVCLFCNGRSIGVYRTQTLNRVRENWVKEA